MPTSKVIAI